MRVSKPGISNTMNGKAESANRHLKQSWKVTCASHPWLNVSVARRRAASGPTSSAIAIHSSAQAYQLSEAAPN